MSIQIMSAVWKHSGYRNERLLVLLALADWANESGVCWPSMSSIAGKARISERGARKIMAQLEAEGVIETIQAGGGRGNTARYRIKGEPCSGFEFLKKGEPCSGFAPTNTESQRAKKGNGGNEKPEYGDYAIRKNRQKEPSKKKTTSGALAPGLGSDVSDLISAANLLLSNLRLPGSPLLVQAIAKAIKFVRDDANSMQEPGYVDATIDDVRAHLEGKTRLFLRNNAGAKRQSLLTFFADALYDDEAAIAGVSLDELKMRREAAIGGR